MRTHGTRKLFIYSLSPTLDFDMTIRFLTYGDDERLTYYRNLPDKSLKNEGRFIAEGMIVTRRLLRSSLICESVLCTEAQLEELTEYVNDVDIVVASKRDISSIVGYDFHRGVLALGRIPDHQWSLQHLETLCARETSRLLLLPHCSDPQNLGSLLRSARAFQFDAVLLGEATTDLYARRVVRVAMGSMFDYPVYRTTDFEQSLCELQEALEVWGLYLHESTDIRSLLVPNHIALMLGHEGEGLSPGQVSRCAQKVLIPIAPDTDSLNISIAGALAMHHVSRL